MIQKNTKNPIAAVLFGLPFASIGVGALGMVLWSIAMWDSMQSWQEVPAYIQKTGLSAHRAKSARTKSKTDTVKAQYTYQWKGEPYIGERVAILSNIRDNIGSFNKRIHKEMEGYRTRNEAFRCYVNPKDPTQSVLYRNLRLELLGFFLFLALTFGGMGFSFVFFAFYTPQRKTKKPAVQQQYPDEPWLEKKEWREGVIHSHRKLMIGTVFLLALFWNFISTPALFTILDAEKGAGAAILLGFVFQGIGVVLIIVFLYLFLQWWKFRNVKFQMTSVSGVLGGKLCGSIQMPTQLLPQEEMVVILDCVHSVTRGSGKTSSTTLTTLWKTEKKISPKEFFQQGRTAAIPVEFYIPYNQPASGDSNPNNSITWSIHAKAPMPGVDLSVSFEVPVFKTPESDMAISTAVLDQGRIVTAVDKNGRKTSCYEPMDETETGDALRHAGLKLKPTPSGGIVIISPMSRRPMRAARMLFSLFVWGGLLIVMRFSGVPILFLIPFDLFFLLMLLLFSDSLVGIHWVIVNREGIRAQGGPFGFGTSHHVSFEAFAGFVKNSNSQVNQTKLYTVILRKRDGKRIKAFKSLERREAQAVIDALNTAVNDYKE